MNTSPPSNNDDKQTLEDQEKHQKQLQALYFDTLKRLYEKLTEEGLSPEMAAPISKVFALELSGLTYLITTRNYIEDFEEGEEDIEDSQGNQER